MLDGSSSRPPRGASLSSSEIERFFPYAASIIYRGSWTFEQHDHVNEQATRIASEHRSGGFNSIRRYRFPQPEQASAMNAYVTANRLHRLLPNSTHGATAEQVEIEWERMEAERDEILAWGRITGMLREVVHQYRFERHTGSHSSTALQAAAQLIEKLHPTIEAAPNHC